MLIYFILLYGLYRLIRYIVSSAQAAQAERERLEALEAWRIAEAKKRREKAERERAKAEQAERKKAEARTVIEHYQPLIFQLEAQRRELESAPESDKKASALIRLDERIFNIERKLEKAYFIAMDGEKSAGIV